MAFNFNTFSSGSDESKKNSGFNFESFGKKVESNNSSLEQKTGIKNNYIQNLVGTPKRIVQDYKTAGENITNAVTGGANKTLNAVNQAEATRNNGNLLGGIKQALGVIPALGETGINAAGEFGKAIYAPIGEVAKGLLPETTNRYINAAEQGAGAGAIIGKGNPVTAIGGALAGLGFQGLADIEQYIQNHSQYFNEHPEHLNALNNALVVGGYALGNQKIFSGENNGSQGILKGKTDLLNTDVRDIPKVIGGDITQTGKDVLNVGKTAISPITSSLANTATNYYTDKEAKDWVKPIKQPRGFNQATDIYNDAQNRGNNIEDTLSKNGIRYQDNVSGGNFNTKDSVDGLRKDIGKASEDIFKPALEQADTYTPKTDVAETYALAEDNINNNNSLTPKGKELALSKIQKEFDLLQEKYPEGNSLVNMWDEQKVFDGNAKYSLTAEDTNTSTANKAIADAYRIQLDNKSPDDLPIKEFKSELQKQYQAIDYLEALDGKKAPKGIVSKIAKTTAKVIGASVGAKLIGAGGGIFGAVGGYHLGGVLEGMFENMSDPARAYFLNNLKTTNPKAFTQVQNYLVQQHLDTSTRLGLPAPGSSTARINLPQPGVLEGQQNINEPINYENSTDLNKQASDLIKDPSSITLFRGENAGNKNGLSFTNNKDWAGQFNSEGNKIKSINLPKNPSILNLVNEDNVSLTNDNVAYTGTEIKDMLLAKGIVSEEKAYKYIFDNGYDVVIQPDSRNPNILEVLVNPKLLKSVSKSIGKIGKLKK